MLRTGARAYTRYPVNQRAFRSMYKGIQPKKEGRRMYRTTYKAIFPEDEQTPHQSKASVTPESGEILQSGPREKSKEVTAAPSLTQGQSQELK
jgi:hypothetical protein